MNQNNMDLASLNVSMQPLAICLESCMENTIPLDRNSLKDCYHSDCEVPYLTVIEPIAVAVVDCIGLGIAFPINIIELQLIYNEISIRLQTAFQDSYSTAFSNYNDTNGSGNNPILQDAYVVIFVDVANKLFTGLEDEPDSMVFRGLRSLFSIDPFDYAGLALIPWAPFSP
jgi:hypothetical protein